jgi:hypothetical protein
MNSTTSALSRRVWTTINVHTYRRQMSSLNAKRSLLSEGTSEIIQRTYSETDQYDAVLRLDDTIEGA